MLSQPLSLLRQIDSKSKRFKILSHCCHEGFSHMMSNINADFYMVTSPGMKQWDWQTKNLPNNHYLHSLSPDVLAPDLHYDAVLCQNVLACYPMFREAANKLGIPLIVLHHTTKPPNISKTQWNIVKDFRGDVNIFITDANKADWEGKPEDLVIYHGIDTEIFKGYTGEIAQGVSLVNRFPERDVFCGWNLWQSIKEKVPIVLYGDNPGLSESINDTAKLVDTLRKYRFFLNTSIKSPIPLSLLEAASIGLPIVSTAYEQVPKVFTHGENAMLSNDVNQLIEYCNFFINNPNEAKKFGQAARQLIIEKYSNEIFTQKWNDVLQKVTSK